MPTGPKGQRRPADVIGNAIRVAQIATGEAEEEFNAKLGGGSFFCPLRRFSTSLIGGSSGSFSGMVAPVSRWCCGRAVRGSDSFRCSVARLGPNPLDHTIAPDAFGPS